MRNETTKYTKTTKGKTPAAAAAREDHPVKHYRNKVASVCHPSPEGNWKL